jgi:hypothetical protein
MSLLHPSRVTRRLLKIASFGLAGLLAGLLSGCSSASAGRLLSHNDTDWQTSSTYASATASLHQSGAARSARSHPCFTAPCALHTPANRTHPTYHRSM